ncbi:ABC transporter substrate-binding protein [Aliikangiella sp. IMCC44359]|uniref:ABC transporter substrate-binding protein n=1 Tax=Aliikangiella sp. IMCC44359 TaxID=3459125 RepID=UPI00403ADAE0
MLLKTCFILALFTMGSSASDALLEASLMELMAIKTNTTHSQGILLEKTNLPDSKSVNIGLLVPFSVFKHASVEYIAAAEFAAREINSQGGINGKRLVIIRGDDSSQISTGVNIVNKMLDDYSIKTLIGPLSSTYAIDIAKYVTVPNNIPMLLPAANVNQISAIKDKDLIFRINATNNQIIQEIIRFTQHNQIKKVAIFYHRDLFGKELMLELIRLSKMYNLNIVSKTPLSRAINYENFNLIWEIKKANKLNADAIFIPALPNQVESIIKQIKALWDGPLPIVLLPEHSRKKLNLPSKNNERNICVYSVIPNIPDKKISTIKGINRTLEIKNASYTSLFIYDLTYLAAAALIYAEHNHVSFSKAIRSVTQLNGKKIDSYSFNHLNNLIKSNKEILFQPQSGLVEFDQQGDNLQVGLKMVDFNYIYGSGCDRAISLDK